MTHKCVSNLTIIGSDNGLAPRRHQTIIWTNDGMLFIGPLGTNFSEIFIRIQTFSFKKMHLKMSSAKWLPFCLGLNVLNNLKSTLPLQPFFRIRYVYWMIFIGTSLLTASFRDCSIDDKMKLRTSIEHYFWGTTLANHKLEMSDYIS